LEKISLKKGAVNLKTFPLMPGVYIFRDSSDAPLYIGKARVLRNRLASYLRPGVSPPPRTAIMLGHAKSVEFIVTNTEKEALILEASMIKRERPRYNIMLRDDKAYPFLCIDMNKPFPRLVITRKRPDRGISCFGPYPSAGAVRETIRFISSLFPMRTCSDRAMKNRQRPCLKYQIKRCCAPCAGKISREQYREMAEQVVMFLGGNSSKLTGLLESKMREAAESMEFEKAAMFRDQLRAINRVLEKQVMVSSSDINRDVLGLHIDAPLCVVSVIRARNGLVNGSETVRLENIHDESREEILCSFIARYYPELLENSAPEDIPSVIFTPSVSERMSGLEKILSEIAGRVIRITRAVRGEARALSDMAARNAEQALAVTAGRQEAWKEKSLLLCGILGISGTLNVIEGVDISNTGGNESVGSLVVFKNGRPFRDGYRIFNIRGVEGPDDYSSIMEVVTRRKKGWEREGKVPDLLLIDGGRGQLAMAERALADTDSDKRPELASIAKDSSGEGEKIYRPGRAEPIFLPAHNPALRLLQHVRDEAHRFGLASHRKKRLKKGISSELDAIRGVGEARKRALLQHFGSVSRIRSASVAELGMARGISEKIARDIHAHFHPGN
jgi:excinuclease ABC subunit C